MGLDPAFKQGFANLTGHPGRYGGILTNDVALAFDDPVDSFTDLRHFEAHPGNSGGPLWHFGPDGRPSVVGLASSGTIGGKGGAAVDIGSYYNLILGWIASNDALIA